MKKSHNLAFGQTIRELRKAKNLSQEALAFDAGFDRTYISLLELGTKLCGPLFGTVVCAQEAPPSELYARSAPSTHECPPHDKT